MKKIFIFLLLLLPLLLALFFSLNLFEARGTAQAAMPPILRPASWEMDNGFYLLWTFAEPPAVDAGAPASREAVRRLLDPDLEEGEFRHLFFTWQNERRSHFRKYWKTFTFFFPKDPQEDIGDFFWQQRRSVRRLEQEFAVLLQRYRLLLQAQRLEDFSQPGREPPLNNHLLLLNSARLYAACAVVRAQEGGWAEAVSDLLRPIACGRKIIACSRLLLTNNLGKSLIDTSLRALASLMSRPEFPPRLYAAVRAGLPPLAASDLGSDQMMVFSCLSFSRAVERMKQEKRIDPLMLKDYFRNSVEFYTVERLINSGRQPLGRVLNPILAVFLKKNETLQLYAAFWEDMRRREALPPFRWGAELADLRPAVVLGPFWWLHNPFGKMIVRSSLPYPWVILMRIVYPTHMLKARYDLTRLACLWNERIASGRTAGLEQELQGFPQKDPFSGAPFRCNSQKSLLYSIGPDGADNGGNEQFIFYRDSDIAVPCRPSAAPAPTSSALRK